MAVSFLNIMREFILSSELRPLQIDSTDSSLKVKIYIYPDTTLYLERLYPSESGELWVYDIRDLVEGAMRDAGQSLASVFFQILNVNDDSVEDEFSCTVLYYDSYDLPIPAASFSNQSFLTTLTMRRVGELWPVPLSFVAKAGESTDLQIGYTVRRLCDDTVLSSEFTLPGAASDSLQVVTRSFSVSDIAGKACEAFSLDAQDFVVTSFTVKRGSRFLSFVVDSSLNQYDAFYFSNCFNVPELICFPAVTVEKMAVDVEISEVCGAAVPYDRSASKTYEAEVGPLAPWEAGWLEQFYASPKVLVLKSGRDGAPVLLPVIVTESTSELSDADTAVSTGKFTWRYADSHIFRHLPDIISSGIFTEEFTAQFS